MCGRFYIPEGDLDDFAGLVSKIEKDLLKKAGEISPGDYAPVITPCKSQDSDTDNDNNVITSLHDIHAIKWGFPVMKGRPIINARSETVKEKPLFKLPYVKKRCLIPARGFFEWTDAEDGSKKRVKHYISYIDSSIMYLAGLYWFFRDKDGELKPYFTILTTQANEEVRKLHDRMPVIIRRDHKEIWLYEKNIEIVDSLLKPLDQGLLKIE
ncbi:MAG TPA: SOS response-associated peptidase [Clostridiaceae bacterium]|nr:SOS response-associated peptidase [Clostridiaceae bacterium]